MDFIDRGQFDIKRTKKATKRKKCFRIGTKRSTTVLLTGIINNIHETFSLMVL